MPIDIIIFAIISVIIFLKLRKEFGKTSDDDKTREKIINVLAEDQKENGNKQIIDITAQVQKKKEEPKKDNSFYSQNLKILHQELKKKVENDNKIKDILKDLDLVQFLKGADNALEITIEAFSKKDLETLKSLLSKNLYLEFKKELDSAEKKKQNIKSSVIAVIKKSIADIRVKPKFVYIDVKFKTEQINFIEDEQNNIVAGNKNKIAIIEEIWSFKKESNPKIINWQIIGITDVKSDTK